MDQKRGVEMRRTERVAKAPGAKWRENFENAVKVRLDNGIIIATMSTDSSAGSLDPFGAMSRSGGGWQSGAGGAGFETVAQKTLPPSATSMTRMSGETSQESAVLALACAIQGEDNEDARNWSSFFNPDQP
jgi:hypothetical protein